MNAAAALADLAARYWAFERLENGLGAFLAGDDAGDPVLFRESIDDCARRDRLAGEFLTELGQIPCNLLDAQDAATHGLLERELRLIRENFALAAHLRPSLLPVGPDFNTVFFANAVSLTNAADTDLYVERLSHFPAFLRDVRARLLIGHVQGIRYPSIVLEAAVRNTSAIARATPDASAWFAPFVKSPLAGSPQLEKAAQKALAIISDELIPALRAHADVIAGSLMEGARETVSCRDGPGGDAWYALLIRQFTTTDMTADDIHALGLAEVSRIKETMAALACEAGFADDLQGYQRFLTTGPQFIAADSNALRERVEVLCKRIDAKIPSYFKRIPRITYGVDVAPSAMSASLPPAYAQPAPSGGTSAGIFWVNGIVEKCPTYILPALAVHEAWPGHLMHIGMMAELDHLPAFRRNGAVKYTACIEGWALYCEQLGIELGIYTTPHEHFGRLEMEMWRACRLVVDTGIHAFDWSRDRAISFLADHLSLSPETISAEVDRYIALPGQALSYHIGGLRVRAMRARAEDAMNTRFDLRSFHETVMTAGPATLPVLDDIVDAWIAKAA
jgi:uncharacterized protein (DUF885 family)